MTKIALYYNPNCPDCVSQAKRTAQMDWLGRVELLTEDSPLGEVPIGEILVVDKQSNKIFTGIYSCVFAVSAFLPTTLISFSPGVANSWDSILIPPPSSKNPPKSSCSN